jgi:hypothetical protein
MGVVQGSIPCKSIFFVFCFCLFPRCLFRVVGGRWGFILVDRGEGVCALASCRANTPSGILPGTWYGVSGFECAGGGYFFSFLVHTHASLSILWHIDAVSGQAPLRIFHAY